MDTINRHWDELKVFRAVLENGGFTRASEALGTSKSLLSKQVQRLETALGTQLLRRTTRSIAPTEAGRMLKDYVDRMYGLGDEASIKMSELQSGHSGTVRISSPVSFGESLFPNLMQELTRELPHVTFDLDLTNEARDFQRDEIDFALRATEVQDLNLVARPLGRLRDTIVATPALAKKLELKNPRELAHQNCILSKADSAWNRWTLQNKSEEVVIEVRGKLMTNQYGMALELAESGLGIARLPAYLVEKSIRDKKLVALFPQYQISTHPLFLVYAKDRYLSTRNRMVRDALLSWFKARPQIFTGG